MIFPKSKGFIRTVLERGRMVRGTLLNSIKCVLSVDNNAPILEAMHSRNLRFLHHPCNFQRKSHDLNKIALFLIYT